MKKIHDVIIVWAGAAGLFSSIHIPKKYSKLLLEKNTKAGVKVLLSWWERANVSNMSIDGEDDYFGQNKKCLKSILTRFNQWDTMNWFSDNNINIIEEDRGRLILESGDSKELLNILIQKSQDNNSDIITWQDVKEITLHPNPLLLGEGIKQAFILITDAWKKYFATI